MRLMTEKWRAMSIGIVMLKKTHYAFLQLSLALVEDDWKLKPETIRKVHMSYLSSKPQVTTRPDFKKLDQVPPPYPLIKSTTSPASKKPISPLPLGSPLSRPISKDVVVDQRHLDNARPNGVWSHSPSVPPPTACVRFGNADPTEFGGWWIIEKSRS